ncbi:Protein of unknown function [Maribacter dokdonensis]|uniref:DUF4230 domain-containing protein n=1 Tax=Maribacter dokdonensis TaxID=320912 RepID=A0ABY0TZG0_9FLAO|nr:DUF4230 domain-containing protein [Maribacter dokdonensis]SDR80863.1 Protein of unknown function [Maribacter dokdonensis]
MKKILLGLVIGATLLFAFQTCQGEQEDKSILKENSMLIQQEITNVSKLVVTEGHFAEVYNYKDSKELFGPLLRAEKKALVVVNADVTVAYDLSKIEFEVDETTKTVKINSIPNAEVKLNPDFEYYDVTADYLNQFDATDYNKIKKTVNVSLMKKVQASSLLGNAENRLISELQKFYILTNSMGWRLTYQEQTIESLETLQEIKPGILP